MNLPFLCEKMGMRSLNARVCILKYAATNLRAKETGRSQTFHKDHKDHNCKDCEKGKMEYEKFINNGGRLIELSKRRSRLSNPDKGAYVESSFAHPDRYRWSKWKRKKTRKG